MKIKKIIFILISNILFLFLFLVLIDYAIYKYYAYNFYKLHPKQTTLWQYAHRQWFPEYLINFESYFNGKNDIYFGRLPDGTQYKDKLPIIVFGCSYAFGEYLTKEQTLSYKLSEQLKRPVFNRGVHGGGLAHMLLQVSSADLYKTIPRTDTIIYVMMSDHYRRTMLQYFDILDYHVYPVFKTKNGELILTDYNNKFMSQIRSWYITKLINHIRAKKYIDNPNNIDFITDKVLLFFNKSKSILEEHYGKDLNFYIIFYEDQVIPYSDILRKKLEKNGFGVISTKELTDKNLSSSEYYMQDKFHPSEKAWTLLTPLIIDKLQLKENDEQFGDENIQYCEIDLSS